MKFSPSNYYYRVYGPWPQDTSIILIYVTPKKYWDKHRCLFDDDQVALEDFLERNGIGRSMESVFEIEAGERPDLDQFMTQLGFIHNPSL